MKIIHVISNLELAGAQTMCCNLLCALKKLEDEITVVSLFDTDNSLTDKLKSSGINVICLAKKMGFDISMIQKLRKIFKKEKPDIIHAHAAVLKYVGPASFFKKAKIVHTMHTLANKEGGRLDAFITRFFYKIKKAFPAALTPKVQKSISQRYRISLEKIPVIYNGIDLSSCIVKDTYFSNGSFKILHIGRFSEEKNHEGLVNAFEIFNKEFPNSTLDLIGDGTLKESIQKLVKEKNLTENVRFLGLQKNVYTYLNEADLFALPSTYEGMPMTLIEAMGTGLPIVASNVGGIPDMLTNESNALLTEVSDTALADAFIMFAKSESLRRQYGQKALTDSKNFSSHNMAKSYYDFYKNVLKQA